MTQQTRFDVLHLERLFEERVRLQVEHTQAEVHAGMEISVNLVELIVAKWLFCNGRSGLAIG